MILFTADIHIKVGQKNVPTGWAINRYNLYSEELDKAQNKADLHIVGGDIFDRMPNLAELSIYFNLVSKAKIETLIYPGNHESTKKHESFFDSLVEVTQSLNPLVKVITKTTEFNKFSILPYADLHKKDAIENINQSLPLFTHVRGEIPPHVKPEVDLVRFSNFPIVYAGDLHSHSNSQLNIVYPGSPMTTSFHRSKVDTGYLLIDGDDLTKWTWHTFNLPQLIRKTVTNPSEMLPTDFDHTIYEIEGDMAALGKIENTELLDKKIVKRETEVTINLANKTLDQELDLYLKDILALPIEVREATLEIFNAYHNKV